MSCPLSALATAATLKDSKTITASSDGSKPPQQRDQDERDSSPTVTAPTADDHASAKQNSPQRRPTKTTLDAPTPASSNDGLTAPSKRRRKSTMSSSSSRRPSVSFPAILMGMLTNPQHADTIAFLSDGERFIVVNPIELERSVLPLYAEELGGTMLTYERFIELLCKWGFRMFNDVYGRYPDINVFSHPLFRKGDWENCNKIVEPWWISNSTTEKSTNNGGAAPAPSELEVPSKPNQPDSTAAQTNTNTNVPSYNSVPIMQPSQASLLRKMEASRESRRLSGVGQAAMQYYVRNQVMTMENDSPFNSNFRRLSLPTALPAQWNQGSCGNISSGRDVKADTPKEVPVAEDSNEADRNDEVEESSSKKDDEQQGGENGSEHNNNNEINVNNCNVMVTNKIMSEAMAALSHQQRPFRRHTVEHITHPTPYNLNAMTEHILKRSMARRLGSRPFFGPTMMYNGSNMVKNNKALAEVGAEVDAQAKKLLAQRRRATLEMNQMMVTKTDEKKIDGKEVTEGETDMDEGSKGQEQNAEGQTASEN